MIKKIVAVIVSIIVTVSIFTPVVVSLVNYPDATITYWQYDDYRVAKDTDTVSGAFEIVEVNDVRYIHAKEVGTGTINGVTETVHKAQLDLAFMCGQSNGAYRNANPETASPIPNMGTAYYFGFEDRCGPLASENSTGMDIDSCQFWSMINTENGILRVGDKAPSYCATYNNSTGHKVYWVCGAIGDKSIVSFDPDGGFMWNYMEEVLTRAISLVDSTKFELNVNYYMWVQGEADSSRSVNSYKSLFLEMHNALLNGECAGINFEGCVLSLVRPKNAVNSSTAQIELAEEDPTIHLGSVATKSFTVDNGLMGSDDVHYSQLGNNIIGTDLAKMVIDLVKPPDYSMYKPFLVILPILFVLGAVTTMAYVLFVRK